MTVCKAVPIGRLRWASALWRFGIGLEPVAARCLTLDRQVAEFQVRVAVLNGYTALGIPVTKVTG